MFDEILKHVRKMFGTESDIVTREFKLHSPGPIVYMFKAGKYYKIGRTNDPTRRQREIKLQLPFEARMIHKIFTDDEVWLEKYWQDKFSSKWRNGEWYELSDEEVADFCAHEEINSPTTQTIFSMFGAEGTDLDLEDAIVEQDEINKAVEEVEGYYLQLMTRYPRQERALRNSLEHQINNREASMLGIAKSSRYQANTRKTLSKWKQNAFKAAKAKVKHLQN